MDTIRTDAMYEETVRHSRFIGLALRVGSEDDFRRRLEDIRRDYPHATHYVYAYILRAADGRLCVRFSDDGEPRHSAGKPVLAPLQGRELMNAAVVVVRYFGGVKLGVGGLVRAYGGVAAKVLDAAGRTPLTRRQRHQTTVAYKDQPAVEQQLAAAGATIIHREFGADVTIHYETDIDWDA
ncbi:MAG: YigZ family protein [Acidobacteria bacterium]|nr:YigZ family protein [Acidobacteriota bacterium]